MKKGYFDLSTTMSKEAISIDTCQLQWTGGPQGLWILHHVHLLRRRTLAPLQNVVYYTLNGGLWTYEDGNEHFENISPTGANDFTG